MISASIRVAGLAIGLLAGFAIGQTTVPSATSQPIDHSVVHPTPPASVPLYSGLAPGTDAARAASPEVLAEIMGQNGVQFRSLTNIHVPSITPFLPPKDKATGAAVIVAPGGGHRLLSIDNEGYDAGRWFADHGVAAFVLKYRLAREPNSTYKVDIEALHDLQRAIRLVRSRAAEWNVNPNAIGALGFSAGGDIVVRAATQFTAASVKDGDAVDGISARPDFHALLYPGLPPEGVKVTADTPPVFLACSYDDRLNIAEGLPQLYLQYHQAKVRAELHVYSAGGHGFGFRPTDKPVGTWPERFVAWLGQEGFAKRPSE